MFDSRGDLVGIVGVQGPAARFDGRAMRAAVPLLLDHAAAVSAALGARSALGSQAGSQTRQAARWRIRFVSFA